MVSRHNSMPLKIELSIKSNKRKLKLVVRSSENRTWDGLLTYFTAVQHTKQCTQKVYIDLLF